MKPFTTLISKISSLLSVNFDYANDGHLVVGGYVNSSSENVNQMLKFEVNNTTSNEAVLKPFETIEPISNLSNYTHIHIVANLQVGEASKISFGANFPVSNYMADPYGASQYDIQTFSSQIIFYTQNGLSYINQQAVEDLFNPITGATDIDQMLLKGDGFTFDQSSKNEFELLIRSGKEAEKVESQAVGLKLNLDNSKWILQGTQGSHILVPDKLRAVESLILQNELLINNDSDSLEDTSSQEASAEKENTDLSQNDAQLEMSKIISDAVQEDPQELSITNEAVDEPHFEDFSLQNQSFQESNALQGENQSRVLSGHQQESVKPNGYELSEIEEITLDQNVANNSHAAQSSFDFNSLNMHDSFFPVFKEFIHSIHMLLSDGFPERFSKFIQCVRQGTAFVQGFDIEGNCFFKVFFSFVEGSGLVDMKIEYDGNDYVFKNIDPSQAEKCFKMLLSVMSESGQSQFPTQEIDLTTAPVSLVDDMQDFGTVLNQLFQEEDMVGTQASLIEDCDDFRESLLRLFNEDLYSQEPPEHDALTLDDIQQALVGVKNGFALMNDDGQDPRDETNIIDDVSDHENISGIEEYDLSSIDEDSIDEEQEMASLEGLQLGNQGAVPVSSQEAPSQQEKVLMRLLAGTFIKTDSFQYNLKSFIEQTVLEHSEIKSLTESLVSRVIEKIESENVNAQQLHIDRATDKAQMLINVEALNVLTDTVKQSFYSSAVKNLQNHISILHADTSTLNDQLQQIQESLFNDDAFVNEVITQVTPLVKGFVQEQIEMHFLNAQELDDGCHTVEGLIHHFNLLFESHIEHEPTPRPDYFQQAQSEAYNDINLSNLDLTQSFLNTELAAQSLSASQAYELDSIIAQQALNVPEAPPVMRHPAEPLLSQEQSQPSGEVLHTSDILNLGHSIVEGQTQGQHTTSIDSSQNLDFMVNTTDVDVLPVIDLFHHDIL